MAEKTLVPNCKNTISVKILGTEDGIDVIGAQKGTGDHFNIFFVNVGTTLFLNILHTHF